MAGNIGGNYIVQFHEKITGFFLLAELNIAFLLCTQCWVKDGDCWVKDGDRLGKLVSREKY